MIMNQNNNTTFSKIALVGNPNCGKTALFNRLTGSKQKVANYPGVTVERKSGFVTNKNQHKFEIIDLPGTYSFRARSPDEAITKDVVLGNASYEGAPDLIVCVASSVNLHLGLRLVLELKKIGKPLILVLNMMDIAKRRNYNINIQKLSEILNIPVISTVATSGEGIETLLNVLSDFVDPDTRKIKESAAPNTWSEPTAQDVRAYHKEIEEILHNSHRVQGDVSKWTERFDKIFLHPVFGLAILFFILFTIFQAVFNWAEVPKGWIETSVSSLQDSLRTFMAEGPLQSLLIDGILAGVGSVIVFLPQILVLFLFILCLEETGYMARAAFLMDRLMGRVGLNGKAFIPLLSSFACAIPGIMAARTIENRKDRLITILIAPLMTCSARLPVYTLIIAAFIPNKTIVHLFNLQGIVLFSLYAAGIVSALLVAWIFKLFFHSKHKPFFLLELPCYKLPNIKNIFLGLLERAKVFLKRAGTIILALMIVIWFLCTYPSSSIANSYAGMIGQFIEPVLRPIGFNWQIAIALIAGFAAREVAVATLATIYALSLGNDNLTTELSSILQSAWILPTALAFLTWYIFAPQCAATLAITKRETNTWRWPLVMTSYMLVLAYSCSWLVYHTSAFLIGSGV